MSLIVSANGGGKDFEMHPAGVYPVRCTRIIDLGTQDGEWEGKAKKTHKIRFAFESNQLMTEGEFEGQPFLITTSYTASLGEKAKMRKDLQSWRGRPFTPQELEQFDLKNVLGKACYVNIIHSEPNKQGKVYANIGAIMPLPAGVAANKAVGELVFFSLSDFDQTVYDKLSDSAKELIAKSYEYRALFGDKPAGKPSGKTVADEIPDDDIPF